MKSTRWIAVAGWLIASPLFAQEFQSPSEATASSPIIATDRAAPRYRLESFDAELEQLGHDLTAIKALREQVAADAKQPISRDAAAVQEQRRELLDLLTKLATKKVPPKPNPEPEPTVSKPTPISTVSKPEARHSSAHPMISANIVDPFPLGRALFKLEDFVGAEQAFRKVEVTDDNRVMLQYLIATCLKRQSRWDQALKAYRIIAENKDDPILRDLAESQLENIRWHLKTEAQLEELRRLREQIEPPATAPVPTPQTAGKPATIR